MQAEREYMQLAASNMAHRLELMEEVSAQNSRISHDQRHFNNVLLELLAQGKTDEATALLQSQNKAVRVDDKVYCENPTVNAAVCHYAALAQQAGIEVQAALDIPAGLAVDSLELSMVVSNLMENAIHACEKLPGGQKRYLRFTARPVGRLLLEMENPCPADTVLGNDGLPVAQKKNHGVGSKSVIAFANQYGGELLYQIKAGVFRVRLLV